ncbi:SDR family oxidoreductase [Sneathiella glossodoripedis]|uniref:SDR family oxidoreductase n=1 Tax=Sneathiella glossodoripedis TaxID=418853 RepID=UPI00046FE029|nr:SDR family oxidoreductase [Sneathiella glossodoripedis]
MAKTVLITGGAKRIGRALSLVLAKAGWNIALHYHNSASEAEEVLAQLHELGVKAQMFRADLANAQQTRQLFQEATEAFGSVTGLINNASLFEREDLKSFSESSFDAHMHINLLAPVLLTQAMAAQDLDYEMNDVSIVNIIDQRVHNLRPGFTSYTLSKAALWTLTQTTAMELAPRIRVNAIGPGPTLASKRQSASQFARQVAQVPLKRGASAEDIAKGAEFLMSSPSITGEFISMDGGQHLPSCIMTEEE